MRPRGRLLRQTVTSSEPPGPTRRNARAERNRIVNDLDRPPGEREPLCEARAMNLEEIAAAGVRHRGLEALLRRTLYRGKVGVIVYHDPTPERFEKHMRFLSQRYNFVTMMQLTEAPRTGDRSEMPANALVITF